MISAHKTICCRAIRFPSCLLVLLVGLSAVTWAAPPVEPAALDYTGTRILAQRDPNLTGQDVLIAAICRSMTYINEKPLNDYRFNMDHDSLYRSDVTFADQTDGQFGLSSHATAVAGMLIGQDEEAMHPAVGQFQYRGACPDAAVDVYEFWRFMTMNLVDKQPFEADIISLSLGETFEDWWTRGLENLAVKNNLIVIASIGNGADTYNLLYPGAGANCIGVGVIDAAVDKNGVVSLREFSTPKEMTSSTGPTSDQRCKPDIVAPGTALVPAHNNGYDYTLQTNWSSLSAPVVSGTTALLLQKAYSDPALGKAFDRPGKNTVIKAVLLNSAEKLPFWHKGQITVDDDHEAPLDFTQGAGALDAVAAYDQLTAGRHKPGIVPEIGWDNRILSAANESQHAYILEAVEPNQVITATLCWNYHYQNQYPFEHQLDKDVNLRLELWGLDPNDSGNDVMVDYCDSLNDNVEHLYYQSGGRFSDYVVRVVFSEPEQIESTAKQRYAVAWSVRNNTVSDNDWWHDLNADNKIDALDNLAYYIIDQSITNHLDRLFAETALNLSRKRIELLESNWKNWKTHLVRFQKSDGN